MNIVIITGGQTGVDRGAHIGAIENGWTVRGYMPKNRCDEAGPIPEPFARHLERCLEPGLPARTRVNVEVSQAVLLCVPDKDDPQATPGTALTMRLAAELNRPRKVVDPRDPTATDEVTTWLRMLSKMNGIALARELRLMVAGPRASRWWSGQAETAGLIRRLKVTLAEPERPLAPIVK